MLFIAYIEGDPQSQFHFEQIAVLLRARGFENELCIYPSPDDAYQKIPFERPDIVFIDLRTRRDAHTVGLDVARTLRVHPLCKNTVFVGMADYAMPADSTAALASGCHTFIPKPARYQAVEDIITHRVLPSRV